ncbi:MAG: TlpA family protein disulfide reductase [Planctomycetaceae bacterium]|nr:TlpA family protein disulfide reductase [Planctomycetaceae bacterium]
MLSFIRSFSFTILPVQLLLIALMIGRGPCRADDPVLHWVSGDNLPGKLVTADKETLSWQSLLFEQPMQIQLADLASVTWPQQERQSIPPGMHVFQMRNGDVLAGVLTGITEDEFYLQTDRHGLVKLLRKQMRLVHSGSQDSQPANASLLYAGPSGLTGWRHPLISSWTEPPGWVEERGGHVTTTRADAVMFRPLQLPDRYEVELILTSTECPSFVFSLGSNTDSSLRLEVWDQTLVAVSNDVFKEVRRLENNTRRLHLMLFVDHVAHRMIVYSESGQQLAELDTRNSSPGNPGLLIRNGSHDLSIEHLTVSQWDGSNFEGVKPEFSRIHLTNGMSYYGQLQAIVGTPDQAILITDDGKQPVKVSEIQGIVSHYANVPERSVSQIAATWSNGELISGEWMKADEKTITVQTLNSIDPIISSIESIQRIRLPATGTEQPLPDRLFFADGTLPGSLTIDNHPTHPILWTPPGGRNAVRLRSGQPARILAGRKGNESDYDADAFPDVIYLRNNDVIPCRVLQCTSQKIQLSSPFFDAVEVDAGVVRAIELANPKQPKKSGGGFSDPNWRRIVGSPDLKPDHVTFRASEAIGHASILNGDVVEFSLSWTENVSANVLLNLFTQIPSNQPGGPAIAFAIRDNTIMVMDGSVDGRRRADDVDTEIKLPAMKARITIFRQGNKLRVSVNGQVAQSFEMDSIDRTSRALLVRASVINRRRSSGIQPPNAVRANGNRVSPNPIEGETFVRLSNLQIRDTVGNSIRHFIDDDAKAITLTVPRFRSEAPATHVLMSPNGDLLRGHLINADETFVRFESQQETLQIERHRIASIIWLTPPPNIPSGAMGSDGTSEQVTGATLVKDEHAIQIVMDQGLAMSLIPGQMDDTALTGTSSVLGNCQIPSGSIREIFSGQWNSDENFASYTAWDLHHAPDPKWQMPTTDEQVMDLVGEPAPDLSLPMLDGSPFRLSDHSGKVLILDFWASWCGPCTKIMPEYVRATSEFAPEKVMLVAVNLKEKPATVSKFLADRNLAPTTLLDRNGIGATIYGVSGIPCTIIIGPDGFVEAVKVGYQPGAAAELRQIVEKILNGTWKRQASGASPAKPNMPRINP